MKTLFLLVLISLFGIFLSSPLLLNAQESFFDTDNIITDADLTDFNSMSQAAIQRFLESHGSYLANHAFVDFAGVVRPASQIIYNAAQLNSISPKVILTMLQKEQSLIENGAPVQRALDWAAGYALCDSCNSSDPALQDFKGFGRQVDFLGKIMRKYYENPSQYTHQVGKPSTVDAYLVTPDNQATANLYNYTPHYQGNFNFWKIWNRYWERSYPDGSLLSPIDAPTVYLIQFGRKRPIVSYLVLLSRFDTSKIITVEPEVLSQFEDGPDVRFANYALLRTEDGSIYLTVDDKLRHIESMEVFRRIGFNLDEVVQVESSELIDFGDGEPITLASVYPAGALLQNNQTGGVYFVDDVIKKAIYSREILAVNFPGLPIVQVAPDALAEYETGDPVIFEDGELIKSDSSPAVYVIASGLRQPFKSGDIFEKLGYKWDNVITTSERVVNLHPLGDLIK